MVGQKHNMVGNLILPQIFLVGQNVWCVLHLVGQFFILVGYCLMPDHYFKAGALPCLHKTDPANFTLSIANNNTTTHHTYTYPAPSSHLSSFVFAN